MPRPKLQSGARPALEDPEASENQRPTAFFVIGCGGHTEAIYFGKLVGDDHALVRVKPLPPEADNLSTPRQTLDRIHKFWRDYDLEEGDQVWAVLDVDQFFNSFNREDTLATIQEARSLRYQVAISNPCFEVWMLMHTNEVLESWPSCDELVAHLRKKWGRYGKKKLDMNFLRPLIRDAIQRSGRSANAVQTPPPNPGTQVHFLLEALDVACGKDKLF